jgi:hypothetical protein
VVASWYLAAVFRGMRALGDSGNFGCPENPLNLLEIPIGSERTEVWRTICSIEDEKEFP